MPFCSKCGAQVTGPFCGSCGASAGAPPPPPAAQPVQPPSAQPYTAPTAVPVKKGKGPLFWTLIGCGGLIIIGVLLMVGGGFFAANKLKQAGFDAREVERNPEFAAAKLIAAMNPEIDVVNTDESAGTITLREKKTGKTVTMNFAEVKKGRISFSSPDEKGGTATMEIGGTDAKIPSWVPTYPGAKAESKLSVTGGSAGESGGVFHFTTKDTPSQVVTFYQDKFKDAGMKITLNVTTPSGAMLGAENEATKQVMSVVVGTSSGDTTVQVNYADKK